MFEKEEDDRKVSQAVEMMGKRTWRAVITACDKTEKFKDRATLQQGSALSPFLFALAIYVLSEEIRNENILKLFYADGLMIRQRLKMNCSEGSERGRDLLNGVV